ncbi:MAG: cytochrome c [Ignavibacteriales bacterium]|nr:cytochrome c [Ignavibacteriales bacterium]
MDVLNNSVLPQSEHHLVLLKYLLSLTFSLFFLYISIVFGSLVYSLFFRRKAEKYDDQRANRFSKELIDIITFNKVVTIAFGVVPILSAVFGYAQLLHNSGLNVSEFLLLALLFLMVALFLVYTYKYTFHLKEIFQFAEDKNLNDAGGVELKGEISSYSAKTRKLHRQSGFYAVIFLAFTIYLVLSAVQLASDTSNWASGNNLLSLIFSFSALIDFSQFLAGAFAITSALVLYLSFRHKKEIELDDNYTSFVKKFSLQSGLVATLILPCIIVLNVMTRQINSLSFDFFGIVVVILILLLLTAIIFYQMIKDSSINYSTPAIIFLVLVFLFLVIKDQLAFDTATKMQTANLVKEYDSYEKKTQEEMGVSAPISGADIYNGRCIACHSFDHKVVGPPYNTTMPKYEGKRDLLVKFILNPVKVNPDYPAMPNQGLKPKEAEAIADYLLKTYKKGQ